MISVTHLSDLRGLICRRQTWHCYPPPSHPIPLLFSAKDPRNYLLLQKIQARHIRKICNFKVKRCMFKMVDNGSAIWGGGVGGVLSLAPIAQERTCVVP